MRYLLDTSFAIDFLRARPEAVSRMDQLMAAGDQPYICDVVVCELATGARPTELSGLDAFIAGVEFVQPGPAVARLAGVWRGAARARGRTLSVPDALIAATADALGASVLTRDLPDFTLTPVRAEKY